MVGHTGFAQSLLGMLGDWAARKIVEGSGHLRAVGKAKLCQIRFRIAAGFILLIRELRSPRTRKKGVLLCPFMTSTTCRPRESRKVEAW